jgi:pimeloyl-ACP methyl ester carboxylesterase
VNELVVDGQRFEYEIIGEGRPVVAVRNVAAPMGGWPGRGDIAAMHEAGLSLVQYRHLGTTDTITGIAADVGRFVDALDLGQKVALWGYSQGAMAAQELALLRPDLVSCAVMMATRARLTAYDRYRYGHEVELDRTPTGALFGALLVHAPDTLADDDLFDAILARNGGEPSPEQRALSERANRAGMSYGADGRLGALRAVTVPCMVVAFNNDMNIPPALNKEVAAAIPGCEYVEVANAGHLGGHTHRHEVRELVLPFLTQPRS